MINDSSGQKLPEPLPGETGRLGSRAIICAGLRALHSGRYDLRHLIYWDRALLKKAKTAKATGSQKVDNRLMSL